MASFHCIGEAVGFIVRRAREHRLWPKSSRSLHCQEHVSAPVTGDALANHAAIKHIAKELNFHVHKHCIPETELKSEPVVVR